MGGPRRRPAAEQDVNADGEIDQPDNPQALRKAAVERFGNHHDRRDPAESRRA